VILQIKQMYGERILLHHQSCNRVKIISDALKTIGSQATIRFSKDIIQCIHYNHNKNVCIIINIDTRQLFLYEYDCDEEEVLIAVRPATISAAIGNRKSDTLVMDYTSGSLKMGLYTTSQQNSLPQSYKRIEITEGEDVQYTPAEYSEVPNFKVTGVVFRNEMAKVTKEAKDIFIRPYKYGLQILGRDPHGIMVYNVALGKIERDNEIFYSPTEEDENVDDDISYSNNYQSVAHDPLSRFDHIQIRYADIVPLIGLSKSVSDSCIVELFYNDDRNLPIKIHALSGNETDWQTFIQEMPEDET
jgi:hypothetical protein